VFCWVTDMGWTGGPLSVFGTHANGATLLLYEGSPDRPDNSRLWRLVEHHRVTMLGVSPTLVRALKSTELEHIRSTDLSSVHVLGRRVNPGTPNPTSGWPATCSGGRVPVINFSGGTEVGGSFLAPYPVESIRSCSLGGPSLGWTSTSSTTPAGSCAARSASCVPPALAVDDARRLEGRRALHSGVLVALPGHLDARRLPMVTMTASGSSAGAPTT
jgi:acyl-coenzyme A synthetase/AMP-(fatty) acid ligase